MGWATDQRILITGASDGIGAELARQLSADRPKLVLAARNREGLERVAADCRARGAEVLVVPTDVGDERQCQALLDATRSRFDGLDVLVNNAGVSTHASLDDALDTGLFDRLLRVNLMGSVWCTRAALPMQRASQGRLVTVCSLAGRLGIAHRTAYCTSKFAQDGFFQALRAELFGSGVSVTLVYPGFVASGFAEHSLGRDGKAAGIPVVKREAVMSVETCAAHVLTAATKRSLEVVLTPEGKVGMALKLVSPALVDGLARRTVARSKKKA